MNSNKLVNNTNTDKIINKKNDKENSKFNKENSKFNIILIGLFILLYILLANKLADILSNSIINENDKLESYTMYIYFIGIMAIIIAYFFIEDVTNNRGNHVVNKGLTYGGTILLLYTIFFYWDYLGDYSKLSLLIISIIGIVYFAYN
jgi:hypothetical protein